MNMSASLPVTDRMLGFVFAALAVTVLALATEAHLLCDLFCIHDAAMAASDICAGRA